MIYFLWFVFLFWLLLISSSVHITCPLSDQYRMFQFIKTLFEKNIKPQVIQINMAVIVIVRYILFINISSNNYFSVCWQLRIYTLCVFEDFPLDINKQHLSVISKLLGYYQHNPLMFQQLEILYKDNMELGHCDISR